MNAMAGATDADRGYNECGCAMGQQRMPKNGGVPFVPQLKYEMAVAGSARWGS